MGTASTSKTNTGARPQISDRERQRLSEKQIKRKKRRFIFVVCTFTVIIGAVLSGLIYGFITVFKITEYKVEGGTTYTIEQVFESSGLQLGKNLFFADTKEAGERIEVGLPYIGNAEVRRDMPGTLKFILTETIAAGIMQDGTDFLLVDKNGKILEIRTAAGEEKIPLVSCPVPLKKDIGHTIEFEMPEGALENPLDTYKNLLAAIASSGMTDITLINMANPMDVTLVYQNRIKMHLGTPAQLESRLAFAVPVIETENAISPVQKGTIDLTILKSACFRQDTES